MAVYETDEIIEKVILVGVAFDTDDDTERLESLPRQQVRRQ
jgi:GTP-binding protein HflX